MSTSYFFSCSHQSSAVRWKLTFFVLSFLLPFLLDAIYESLLLIVDYALTGGQDVLYQCIRSRYAKSDQVSSGEQLASPDMDNDFLP